VNCPRVVHLCPICVWVPVWPGPPYCLLCCAFRTDLKCEYAGNQANERDLSGHLPQPSTSCKHGLHHMMGFSACFLLTPRTLQSGSWIKSKRTFYPRYTPRYTQSGQNLSRLTEICHVNSHSPARLGLSTSSSWPILVQSAKWSSNSYI